ncbi:MAG: hypothetical protein WBG23_05485 [Acidobacteriaceae bacterium]|jgi:hypothetical protein
MKNPATTNILLLVIAVALIAIALKPLRQPPPARAQTQNLAPLYIEPGTQLIRAPDGSQNVYGKMVVDLSTGRIWGFPTLNGEPYPVDTSTTKPPVSHAIFLGTFAFSDMSK